MRPTHYDYDIDLHKIVNVIPINNDYLLIGTNQIAYLQSETKRETAASDMYVFSATSRTAIITDAVPFNNEYLVVATSNGVFKMNFSSNTEIDLKQIERMSWGECTVLSASPSKRLFVTHNVL
jgi:hypothetical protein